MTQKIPPPPLPTIVSPLRDRLREATTLEILNAAESVLAEQGLVAASMAAIAQQAGVSVGTLYNYFKDKEQLLSTLLELRRADLRQKMDAVTLQHASSPFAEHLAALVLGLLELFDGHRNFLRITLETERFLPGLAPSAGRAGEQPQSALQAFINRFRPVVAKGLAERILRDEGADVYPVILAGLIRGVMSQRLVDNQWPLAKDAPIIVSLFLNGAKRSL